MSEHRLDLAVFLPTLAGGGAERIMVMLCNALARRGKRVALVLAMKEGPYLAQIESGVAVIGLDRRSLPGAVLPLARFLRSERPRAMLSGLDHANMAAIAAARVARVATRVVVSEHNTLSQVVAISKRRFVSFLPLALRFTYPLADGVIAVSRGVADDLSRQIGLRRDRIDVVYNPIAVEEAAARRNATPPHPWLAPGEPSVILSAGRLTANKDHANLLEAFLRLRRKRPCRLVILGEGPLRGALERLARELGVADDVLMPGFQENLFDWMHASRVFVLPSHNEGFGNVLVEAMACGTPVVSTDCQSGPAEILENGKWGRLVPVGDAAAMADAIAATLDDPQHPDVAARAADFSVDRAAERYAEVLELSL